MKINKRKSSRKPIIVILLVILFLVGATVAYAYMQKIGPFEEKGYSTKPSTQEEKNAGTDIKKNSLDQDSTKGSTGSDPSPDPTPDPNGGKPGVGVEITAANQNGEMINIRALIQTITSSGACSLSMTGPSGKTYSAAADVQALPSSSTCKGFDVPTSELSKGTWNIVVSFENSDVKGSASKEIEIK